MDRLDGLQAFVAVAESGSFRGAAGRLGIGRALVSKRIAGLERGLGVRLLNRTTRRVSLTDPGQELLGRAQRIIAEYDEARAALAHLQSAPAGRLKLSAGVSFSLRHLACVVAEFMTAHPQLVVEMMLNDRFVDRVDEGFDLCVRIGALGDSALVARRLTTVHRVICAAPDYVDRVGTPASPSALAALRGLHYSQTGGHGRWHLRGPEGAASVELPAAFCSNNGDVLLAAAIAGEGVASLPTFIAGDSLRAGTLIPLLPSWRQQPLVLAAMWPASRYLPLKVRMLVDFLAARYGDPAPWDLGLEQLLEIPA